MIFLYGALPDDFWPCVKGPFETLSIFYPGTVIKANPFGYISALPILAIIRRHYGLRRRLRIPNKKPTGYITDQNLITDWRCKTPASLFYGLLRQNPLTNDITNGIIYNIINVI